MIRAVLFDVIGTTVIETDPNTITGAFDKAFRDHGLTIDQQTVRNNRGRDKREMIELLLVQGEHDLAFASPLYDSFVRNVEAQLHQFRAREGAQEIFDYLQKRDIKIGLGTGLSRDLFTKIMQHIGWSLARFDYVGIPENGIRPRPHPDMILDMLAKLNLTPNQLLKVGDTVADIQEGKAAGVVTAAIQAGTQTSEQLKKEKPDYLVHAFREIEFLL